MSTEELATSVARTREGAKVTVAGGALFSINEAIGQKAQAANRVSNCR